MPRLEPPICLQVQYYNVSAGPTANTYAVTLISNNGQSYAGGAGLYTCEDIAVGMYTGNNAYGYIFRIQSISYQIPNRADVILEDISGFNALIDPADNGGGPTKNQ